MSTRVSDATKLAHLTEQFTLHWRANMRVLATRDVLGHSGLTTQRLNEYGRKAFADGKTVDIDGTSVVVTYFRGGWSLMLDPMKL